MKRIVSVLLAMFLCITIIPTGAIGEKYADIPVTITTQAGDPTYTVEIPSDISLSGVKQNTEIRHKFNIAVKDVMYLDTNKIYVQIDPTNEDKFELKGSNSNTLPFTLYNLTDNTSSVSNPLQFATFTEDRTIECELFVDKANITEIDTYSGNLIFFFHINP